MILINTQIAKNMSIVVISFVVLVLDFWQS